MTSLCMFVGLMVGCQIKSVNAYADQSSIEQLIPSLILDNHMKTLRYLGNEKQSGYVARCSFCGTKSLIDNAYHD